jgi:hypothetical protein
MRSNIILLACVSMILFAQCGGGSKESTTEGESEHASGSTASEDAAPPQFIVENAFKQQLVNLLSSYIKVKDALVASDAAAAKSEAEITLKMVRKVEAIMLSGAALNDWTNYSGQMIVSLTEIASSTDTEIQRTAFQALSENLYKSIRAYGLGTTTAYYEFCPMAFNNQGAYWISDSKEIRNPYFGDQMLTCGRVEEKLQ